MLTTKRQALDIMQKGMREEYWSFESQWQDLGDYILPNRIRLHGTDYSSTNRSNVGERKDNYIANSTASFSSRTLSAGMMGNITNPASIWFKISIAEPAKAELYPVKTWLDIVTKRMSVIFLRSNLYRALPVLYTDIGTFATGAMLMEEDFDTVVRFYNFPIGTYMLSLDEKLKVVVFFREFTLNVRQLISKFGMKEGSADIDWSVFSSQIKTYYDNNSLDTYIDICHVIQPNKDYDPKILGSKKFESLYYEKGSSDAGVYRSEVFLSEKGYDFFPVLVGRWEVTGEDVYGTNCPGMLALGDIKGLQIKEKRKSQAIEKGVNPAMVGPTSMSKSSVSILPGDMNYVDESQGNTFRAAHQVTLSIGELKEDIYETEQRIKRAYFEDLFLMLANINRSNVTATEVNARIEEKLLILGPVLEQLNQGVYDQLISNTFDIMLLKDLLPPPPEELEGETLKIEYISIMHQAQKMVGLSGIERLSRFTGELAQFKPEVLDKMNFDQIIDEYGDMMGVPVGVIYTDDVVEELRDERARVQQAMQAAEQAKMMAGTAKDLSSADMKGNNALSAIIEQAQAGAA